MSPVEPTADPVSNKETSININIAIENENDNGKNANLASSDGDTQLDAVKDSRTIPTTTTTTATTTIPSTTPAVSSHHEGDKNKTLPIDTSTVLLQESSLASSQKKKKKNVTTGGISSFSSSLPQSSSSLTLSPPNRKSKRIQIRHKSKPTPKFLSDTILVNIPMDVTADLKIAIEKTKFKRLRSLYKKHPSLKKKSMKQSSSTNADGVVIAAMEDGSKADDATDEDGDGGSAADGPDEGKESTNDPKKKKKKKSLTHVPQPEQYGSVLDYLEAKYVRGVMLGDEAADGESLDEGSEGAGSIYSGGSFLDDQDLQRDVAEQVMANTTLTKLELEDEDGDGDFFVNVGNLEIEENEYGENYDPTKDKDSVKQTKKRKKPQIVNDSNKTSTKKKTKQNDTDADTLGKSSNSKKSTTSLTSQKKGHGKPKTKEGEANDQITEAKIVSDKLFKQLAAMTKKLTADDLPRKKKNLTVSLTCPANKNPGEMVTFTNPLNKEQKMRAKIPKNTQPGGTFRVSVPIPKTDEDEEDGIDRNTFSREWKDLADDYARAYDDWCNAQSAADKTFPLLKQKQAKWDSVIKLFPKDLITPISVEYMKKLIRRSRQSRTKRKKAASETNENKSKEKKSISTQIAKRSVLIPMLGTVFPGIQYDPSDFEHTT